MTYILGAQRDGLPADTLASFKRYRAYLEGSRSQFPPGAYSLATSNWYYNFEDQRCPHDPWLEQVAAREAATDESLAQPTVALEVRLLGAYQDGYISLRYPQVFAYRLDAWDSVQGHREWRFDEFRLSDSGPVIREIEWAGAEDTSPWLIEASDVQMAWEAVRAAG